MNTSNSYKVCQRCLSDSKDFKIVFNQNGICNYCEDYFIEKEKSYYVDRGGDKIFLEIVNEIKSHSKGKYDCILGLSGGVDSSYLAYKLKEYDLNILAVHVDAGWNTEISVSNIKKVLDYTKFDLETIVLEWDEIRRLQLACLEAGIMNQDIVQDHAFFSSLYRFAKDQNISYVFNGSNIQTEGVKGYFGHNNMDDTYLKDIFRKHGKNKIQHYPYMGFFEYYFLIPFIHKVKIIKPFHYLEYNKMEAERILNKEIGYTSYKYKHGESVWTRFFQDMYLPKKFNYDKRKAHLSSQIFSNQLTREDAIKQLAEDAYDMDLFEYDVSYISRKLEIDREKFLSLLDPSDFDPNHFKTNDFIYSTMKKIQIFLQKILNLNISNYS